jgi:F-type H+-transporting ATPase subunit epsilon
MANTLKLEIVTPESRTFSEVIARKDGRDLFLAVGDGFVEITGERVAIMTDMAIRAENIDEAKAEEARKRAESRLAERLGHEESAMVSAALANSLAQLKVKRRQRS